MMNVWEHLIEQDLPMVRDFPPRSAPDCNLVLDQVTDLVELFTFKLVIDWASFADDSSQVGRWRCNQQDFVAVIEVVKDKAGAARQSNSQVKDIRFVGFKDWILRPAEIDKVCEPHEAKIAEVADEHNAQSMQKRQVFHTDQ